MHANARRIPAALLMLTAIACEPRTRAQQETAPAETVSVAVREGTYALTASDGEPLPAVVEKRADCDVEVLAAALTLRERRFAYSTKTRERCAGRNRKPTETKATGTYSVDEGQLLLATEEGTAFAIATGLVGEDGVTLKRLETQQGVRDVHWSFGPGAARE